MKNKILRVIAAILTTLSVLISLVGCSGKTDEKLTPTEKFFVNDFASVMTEDDINTVCTKGAVLQEQTAAQAVIVTVEDLDGEEISDYALNLGRDWGVGDAEKNNGIVVLFSENDREIHIAVGYGLEGTLPDSKTGRIIDTYGIPYFEEDNFSMGLVSIYNSVVNEIYVEYGIAVDENYTPVTSLPSVTQDEENEVANVAISWLILILLILLYVFIFGRRGGVFIFGSPKFSNFHFHSGGFRGGSSGGFGGFKGGGGSFGGGGAGRKF